MQNNDLKYKDTTHKVIGCAMEVHKNLGSGFMEIIYQRALVKELNSANLQFTREAEMPIIYKGENLGSRRVDFFVEGKIMIEIKATSILEMEHYMQIKNYIESAGIEVGLLLNFGGKSLEYKRIENLKLKINKSVI
jgi:GxxExxY protein